jgi:flagellar assembly protein FliH
MSSFSSVRPYIFAPLDLALDEEAVVGLDKATADAGLLVEPALPPIDVEAVREEARREGFLQGHDEGFQQGYGDGLRQAQTEQRVIVDRLADLVQGALDDADAYVRAIEGQVVELSLAVAQKVIDREATVDPAVVVGVVRSALAELHESATVHVRVNPEDYALVAEHWDGLVRRPGAERSSLVPDESLDRGGCLIQTGNGEVDARFSTKLSQIATTFQALLDGELA